jgi:integrase
VWLGCRSGARELANRRASARRDPEGLTPHSLRRTFASLLFAVGEAPPYVMRQMGHTSANLTLSIYARTMDRRDGEPERLRALVNGEEWAQTPAAVPAASERHPIGTRAHSAVEAARA